MDPESALDATRNVGIRDGSIVAISESALDGTIVVDVSGLVVAPGFIDLHAHGQDLFSSRLQAQDGVTTALELEGGAGNVEEWYARRDGRAVLNYGAKLEGRTTDSVIDALLKEVTPDNVSVASTLEETR